MAWVRLLLTATFTEPYPDAPPEAATPAATETVVRLECAATSRLTLPEFLPLMVTPSTVAVDEATSATASEV